MLYCRDCGQCSHIDEESFIQYSDTSGWESAYIDCNDGEYVDYKDGETTDTDVTHYECGHCDSSDIEWDSEKTPEQAFAQRALWQARHDQEVREAVERRQVFLRELEEDRTPQWDTDNNEVEEVSTV